MNKFKTKILSIAMGFCLLETASYASSKRPDIKSFTVALDCRTGTVSWTGAPSNAGSIAVFGISDTQKITQAVANIPATHSRVTYADKDTLPAFSSFNRPWQSEECAPMLSYELDSCPGDLEITAFAIQDPILVKKGKGYNNPSPLKIRDLAASQALESTSIIIQCPQEKAAKKPSKTKFPKTK